MGSILGCRKAALAMAAGMSLGRSPFLRVDLPLNKKNGADDERNSVEDMKKQRVLDERKALLEDVGSSDHSLLGKLAFVAPFARPISSIFCSQHVSAAIYLKWDETNARGGDRKRLCDSLGLSFTGMRDMMQLVKQYNSSLNAAGYVASKDADRNMKSWRIIRTCAVAALAPSQLVRVQRSAAKYDKTIEGAVEKDGLAKELKLFIRPSIEDHPEQAITQNNRQGEERVFIHPSSFNFAVGSYACPWLVYHSLVRTSKPFLRDVSECTAYSLLLFAGDLEVQATEGVVVIDKWVKLEAKARIGSLIGGLRQKVDDLLAKKIDDPSVDLANTNEMKLIVKLLVTDGLG
jgi:ATP-dependent RNA helicase DHX57